MYAQVQEAMGGRGKRCQLGRTRTLYMNQDEMMDGAQIEHKTKGDKKDDVR